MSKVIPEAKLISDAIGEEKYLKLFKTIAHQHPEDEQAIVNAIANAFAEYIAVSERMARIVVATSEWHNGSDDVSFLMTDETKELHALADIVSLPIARKDLADLRARLVKLHKMRDDLHTLTTLLKDVKPSKQLKDEIADVESSIAAIQRNHSALHPAREKANGPK